MSHEFQNHYDTFAKVLTSSKYSKNSKKRLEEELNHITASMNACTEVLTAETKSKQQILKEKIQQKKQARSKRP
jgi:SOS response regulatory protein OraA/RecX